MFLKINFETNPKRIRYCIRNIDNILSVNKANIATNNKNFNDF